MRTLILYSSWVPITGKCIHSMVAHLDAVTSLAVDPNGLYLMSGSKYLSGNREVLVCVLVSVSCNYSNIVPYITGDTN